MKKGPHGSRFHEASSGLIRFVETWIPSSSSSPSSSDSALDSLFGVYSHFLLIFLSLSFPFIFLWPLVAFRSTLSFLAQEALQALSTRVLKKPRKL